MPSALVEMMVDHVNGGLRALKCPEDRSDILLDYAECDLYAVVDVLLELPMETVEGCGIDGEDYNRSEPGNAVC